VRIPLLADEAPPDTLTESFMEPPPANGSDLEHASLRILPPRHTNSQLALERDAKANVRWYDHLAKEVLMEVLGYLLVRLGSDLVRAVAEVLTIWSLDTVNTDPLTRSARARTRWDQRYNRTRSSF
jgi:hypothetical protein